jgi:hypothetical protein
MTILSTIMGVESSGGNNITQGNIGDINNRTGDLAQGYFQITGGTWAQFGGAATGYGSAIQAPYATQVQIAQNIPVARWGPATQTALGSAGYFPQSGETLGQMMTRYGEDPSATTAADGSTVTGSGTTIANGPPDNASGSTPASGSTDPLGTSVTMNPSGTSLGNDQGTPNLGGGVSQSSEPAGSGTPEDIGLQSSTTTDVTNWIKNLESSFGSGLQATLKAAETGLGTYFGSVQNWFTRAFLIIVGIVILAVALIALMWDHGGKNAAQQVVRVAAV